jgi:hypothetical protein
MGLGGPIDCVDKAILASLQWMVKGLDRKIMPRSWKAKKPGVGEAGLSHNSAIFAGSV